MNFLTVIKKAQLKKASVKTAAKVQLLKANKKAVF